MWLTYLEASRNCSSGDLTWDEYIEQLLSRAAGAGNINDEREGGFSELSREDPFAYTVWSWSGNYLLKDASPLKEVFVAYGHGTLEHLQEKIATLRRDYGTDLMKSLALLALQERQVEVLKLCFAYGDSWQTNAFEDEANRVDKDEDPEVFEVLEAARFRELYPRKEARPRSKKQRRRDNNDPATAFDVGGSHPVDW